jgi:membrane dipeptidase
MKEPRAYSSEYIRSLISRSVVWDNNLSWDPVKYGDIDHIKRYLKTGIKVIGLSVAFRNIEGIEIVIRTIAKLYDEVKKHPDIVVLCKTVDDILETVAQNKAAVFLSFQETIPFEENLTLIGLWYELGVRYASLAYNIRNSVGDGCAEPGNAGLSLFGRDVIREMNRVGMIVDGAHSGHRTTMEAMEICEAPFMFSHTNIYAVHPHFRNIRDDQIKACAKTGGVIGITGCGEYMGEEEPRAETMFRHIDYVAHMVGPEHVGFGFDYVKTYKRFYDTAVIPRKNLWPLPPGGERRYCKFLDPEKLLDVVELMLKHGYTEKDIRCFLGDNFVRLARAAWK